jgi:hypothetical protein
MPTVRCCLGFDLKLREIVLNGLISRFSVDRFVRVADWERSEFSESYAVP